MDESPAIEIHYSEHDPPAALRPYVRCFWRLRAPVALGLEPLPEPILPDGCVEIVLHLGDPFLRCSDDGRRERQPRALVAGQITRAIVVQPSRRMDVWGIRLHPWSAGAFLDVPTIDLRDSVVALDVLSMDLDRKLAGVGEQIGDDRQLDLIVRALSEHVSSSAAPDRGARLAVGRVVAQNADYSVRGLAKELGLSARRVDAIFREHVGLSPKQLLRIHRFQRALALRRAAPSLAWASVAARAGYFDQAHLVREARAIAGSTPTELSSAAGGLTEIFLARDAST